MEPPNHVEEKGSCENQAVQSIQNALHDLESMNPYP